MAKRNKDRGTSRPFEGGPRATQSTRHILGSEQRRVDYRDPMDAIGGSFYRPDLSAFETAPINEVLAPAPQAQPVRRAQQPARVVGGSRAVSGPSKRAVQRAREADPRGRDPIKLRTAQLLKPQDDIQRRASPNVTHEVRPARVEKAHATCKSRPRDTRPKGKGGSGKAYVPWCDRKR